MRKSVLFLTTAALALTFACTDDTSTGDEVGDTGDATTGDGDGDATTGDGDGDATTGDGDGDATTGDGDGDPQPVCGDGNVDAGEECDEGGESATCDADCSAVACGDGYTNVAAREGCDDGNDVDGDGCTAACALESCGDGVLNAGEECDDANDDDTDECLSTCFIATCGDSFVQEGVEVCDGGGETDTCNADCTAASCGDGVLNVSAGEACDDANDDDTDDCTTACADAACGDGFVWAGNEECDDGNDVDDDLCSNICAQNLIPLGTIMLGGSSFANITTALDTIGEPYTVNNTQWLPANAANILIMSNDGGNAAGPDYLAHLNSGKHILMFGGSGLEEYRTYWTTYFSIAAGASWHQSNDCMQDWNESLDHPLTALLPQTYEFPSQSASYHMMHFNEAGQPADTTLIGRTCHQAPNNYVLATRSFANGGTLTYMLLDLGPYANGNMQAEFVVPFIQGYFDWLQQGAP